jgi:hypothetical protein
VSFDTGGTGSMNALNVRTATEEAREYGARLVDSGALSNVCRILAGLGEENLQGRGSHEALRSSLLGDIDLGAPFSLIRLGDGEGNVLFWGKYGAEFPNLARVCMERIWRVMFGRISANDRLWDQLYEGISTAALNARYVGIPTLKQTEQSLARLSEAREQDFDLRGTTGVASVWDWYRAATQVESRTVQRVVEWHVHLSLLEFYGDLIRRAGNISVITCYGDLLSRLRARFGVERGGAFLVPPQAVNIKGTPDAVHFPDAYQRIVEALRTENRGGQLFFVGAGLVGKLYCEEIRQAGGMAIDVGSLMDVWVGEGVRPYQTKEFVSKHQIVGESSADE